MEIKRFGRGNAKVIGLGSFAIAHSVIAGYSQANAPDDLLQQPPLASIVLNSTTSSATGGTMHMVVVTDTATDEQYEVTRPETLRYYSNAKGSPMLWAKRRFSYADYAPYFDKMEKMIFANPTLYRQFIMVSSDRKGGESDVYVGVPNRSFMAAFDGFEPVAESELPKVVDVLIADTSTKEFTSRFAITSAA